MDKTPLIFDIKRYAINDGPGIRTTIFFKGCPLQCPWCHNPESFSSKTEKMYSSAKCIGCQECIKWCPNKVCELTSDGIVTNPDLCLLCGVCADVCPTQATEMSGRVMFVDEVMAVIKKEITFFDQSGGGVSFSGGEPLLFPQFLLELLNQCGQNQIHRIVDTTGYCPEETLLEVAGHTEHFLYDLKMMDSAKHKKFTGVGNELILNNLQTLAKTGRIIDIRIPLIHGVNDDLPNIEESAAFIAKLAGPPNRVDILPYHNITSNKYSKLGRIFHPGQMAEPTQQRQEEAVAIINKYGLDARIN
ncbi:MAG: glycyl-radical enzyme activating protein [Gemmatimonadales bacterium]|nr:glycyl-radical enzyme activating protein [Gemmatimonadales bacterium]